jgi:3-oxoacyl-[acyl-carrier-protein] synthase III
VRSPELTHPRLDARASELRPPRAAALTSVAMAVPERVIGNDLVAQGAGVTEQWIVHRTGVRERRAAAPGERVTDLAAAAGRAALERAGLDASELDLLLVATLTPDELTPNAAPLVAHELGVPHAAAMDIGAACTGFLSALSMAAAQVEGGRSEHALVIGAELLRRLVDETDRGTAALFGDGAGAVVVSPAENGDGRIGEIVLRSDGRGAAAIRATHEDGKIRMQGHDTFKNAVQRLSESTVEAAERAGLALDDIDLFVYHQANTRILAAVGERLGLDPERVIDCIDRYGNTSSATIPIALVEAERRGMLEPGMNVLLGAFGAGFTWGAGVIEWAA